MLRNHTYPNNFDSYGRQITREAYMNTHGVDMSKRDVTDVNCYPVQTTPVSPLDIKYNKGNNCNRPNDETNNDNMYPDCSNHALYLKYSNVRIKYVGFIYNRVNYIVDLDNRKVLFKPINHCTKYEQLANRVTVTSDSLTCSYKLGFNLYKICKVASVEIYPNDIENCNVIIFDKNTHEKEILDKDYISFEFFEPKNMLDANGNIITFINYSDIFKLTTNELMTLFTYPESIGLIKEILNNVMCSKDLVEVVKKLLIDVRTKYLDWMNGNIPDCDGGMGNIEDNEFPECDCHPEHRPPHHHDHDCDCDHEHHHPPKPPVEPTCPPHYHPEVVTEDDVIGKYYNENTNEIIILEENNIAHYNKCSAEDRIEWSLSYAGNMTCDKIDEAIVELYNIDTMETFRFSYIPDKKYLIGETKCDIFKRDIKDIPSIDFSYLGNSYVAPLLIFRDGEINTKNTDIYVLSDTDFEKKIELDASREYILNNKSINFLFRQNSSILENTMIGFSCKADIVDFERPNFQYSFSNPFNDNGCETIHHHKDKSVYSIKLNSSILSEVRKESLNYIYVIIKCRFKDIITREYMVKNYITKINLV